MKLNDKDLDPMIREALSREEAELFDRLGKPTLPDLITDTFKGRFGLLNFFSIFWGTIFVGLSIVSAIGFFRADESIAMFRWFAGLSYSLLIVFGLKIWYWMELNRAATAREIKRVELQIARLSADLKEQRTNRTPSEELGSPGF